MQLIDGRRKKGDYPEDIDDEVIDLTRYWISGLYAAEPILAATTRKIDGWPIFIAKILRQPNCTPIELMKISDIVRKTATQKPEQFSWSKNVISPAKLLKMSHMENLYFDFFLGGFATSRITKQDGASGQQGGGCGKPATVPYWGGVNNTAEARKSEWRDSMHRFATGGFYWSGQIELAHQTGDFDFLQNNMPRNLWKFVEEYRQITEFKKKEED